MTNEQRHTPGPWKFSEGEYFYVNARVDGRRVFILQRKKAVVAASTEYMEAEEDRIRADCLLIAAAPDLLKACEAMSAHYSGSLDHQPAYVALARAAIAKATGESP